MVNTPADKYDICILGGGAAGMAAAVAARREAPAASVLILEKNDRLGKKLYATGNGRCNLTNMAIEDVHHMLDFFSSLGLATREEEGRVYPASEQAEDVVYVLERFLTAHNIRTVLGATVTAVEPQYEGFRISYTRGEKPTKDPDGGSVLARKVLLALGGKAGPSFGTTGDGFVLARTLGCRVETPYPVLTGVETALLKGTQAASPDLQAGLHGVRVRASVSLFCGDKVLYREEGQIQMNDYGLSGIPIMNATSFVRLDKDHAFSDYRMVLDLLPKTKEEELAAQIVARLAAAQDPLRSFVPRRLCQTIASMYGVKEGEDHALAGDMAMGDMLARTLAYTLKNLTFALTGVRGWRDAQCTGGGVALSEVDEQTMGAQRHEGLYFAGEILAYAGPCGGYNLHHAFTTGLIAGKEMAHAL